VVLRDQKSRPSLRYFAQAWGKSETNQLALRIILLAMNIDDIVFGYFALSQ